MIETPKMRYVWAYMILGVLVLPIVAVTANPSRDEINLGKALFQDKQLSVDRSIACASCHQPDHAFSDSRAVSVGVGQQTGTRNAPSLLDISEYHSFFWDGRAASLEQQASVPFLSLNELGFSTLDQVVARVEENPRYVQAFKALDVKQTRPLQFSDVARALIAYEGSLTPAPSAVSRYLAGDKGALSLAARRGLALFQGRADCASCHLISAHAAPLTDNEFHSSGVGLVKIAPDMAQLAQSVAKETPAERYQRIESDPKLSTLGRYVVTLDPKDIGMFRTPSLRDVALTAPYMHDGSVPTLAQAVDIELYYRGLKLGHPILLTADERQELMAFLESLSSPLTASATLSATRTAAARKPQAATEIKPQSRML